MSGGKSWLSLATPSVQLLYESSPENLVAELENMASMVLQGRLCPPAAEVRVEDGRGRKLSARPGRLYLLLPELGLEVELDRCASLPLRDPRPLSAWLLRLADLLRVLGAAVEGVARY